MNALRIGLLALLLSACAMEAPAPKQYVYFIEPADGATVVSPFIVKFGVIGMDVAPAGTLTPNSGHHHLLVNLAPIPTGEAIPADAQHLHFGKGQTEASVTLAPGTYKLTMQFADGAHRSYGPAMAKSITVHVQ